MAVIDLKAHPTAHWKQVVLRQYAFLPYWWIRAVTTESRRALMNRDLDAGLATDKTCLLGYTSDAGDLLGFAHMRWLEWDTDHFGFEIWRLEHLGIWNGASRRQVIAEALVQGLIQAARERGCRSIQARIPIDNLLAVHCLEDAGFRTMEVTTTWLFDVAKSPIPSKRYPELVRDFEPGDTEALIELAGSVYAPIPGRFRADPHLSSRASNELYAEWVRNSCSGQLADHIAVAESDGRAVGYATMKYFGDHEGLCSARMAQLLLGGMSPDFRNRGIVADLVIHNLEWLQHRQADFGFVGTQGNNIPPQRVWLRVGFKPAMMSLSLHYWMDE